MEGLLRRKQVEEICSISRSTLYRYVGAGLFPKPVRIGKSSVRWRVRDVKAWLEQALEDLCITLRGAAFRTLNSKECHEYAKGYLQAHS